MVSDLANVLQVLFMVVSFWDFEEYEESGLQLDNLTIQQNWQCRLNPKLYNISVTISSELQMYTTFEY